MPAQIPDYLEEDVFAALAFVPYTKVGSLIFISGVAPLQGGMEDLRLIGKGDMAEQMRFILKTLDAILAKEGLKRAAIASWTVYTTDMPTLMDLAPTILAPWAGGANSSATFVGCASLAHPDQMIEIASIVDANG